MEHSPDLGCSAAPAPNHHPGVPVVGRATGHQTGPVDQHLRPLCNDDCARSQYLSSHPHGSAAGRHTSHPTASGPGACVADRHQDLSHRIESRFAWPGWLATDWMYARTRNPMLLCTLALLLSFGLRYRSTCHPGPSPDRTPIYAAYSFFVLTPHSSVSVAACSFTAVTRSSILRAYAATAATPAAY